MCIASSIEEIEPDWVRASLYLQRRNDNKIGANGVPIEMPRLFLRNLCTEKGFLESCERDVFSCIVGSMRVCHCCTLMQ